MDTRDTPEQARAPALRPPARPRARARRPSPISTTRRGRKRLAAAVRDAGWLELRDDGGDGAPLASGVEAAIVADALGGAVADVAFAGPVLARRSRRAGPACSDADGAVVAFSPALTGAAVRVADAVDDRAASTRSTRADESAGAAFVLVPGGRRRLPPRGACRSTRRSRPTAAPISRARCASIPPGAAVDAGRRPGAAAHRRRPRGVDRARARAHERRSRRRHARRARRHGRVRGASASSTACPSVRSRRCSICSPRRAA